MSDFSRNVSSFGIHDRKAEVAHRNWAVQITEAEFVLRF